MFIYYWVFVCWMSIDLPTGASVHPYNVCGIYIVFKYLYMYVICVCVAQCMGGICCWQCAYTQTYTCGFWKCIYILVYFEGVCFCLIALSQCYCSWCTPRLNMGTVFNDKIYWIHTSFLCISKYGNENIANQCGMSYTYSFKKKWLKKKEICFKSWWKIISLIR